MSRVEWIVCERSGLWATALRMALGRSRWPPQSVPRLFEVRQFSELSARLEARPDFLAFVEVQRANIYDVLIWLAEAGRVYPRARVMAMITRGDWEPRETGPPAGQRDLQPAIDALREAGAVEVVTSPRQLQGILALGHRQELLRTARRDAGSAQSSIAEWARQSLPWQAE